MPDATDPASSNDASSSSDREDYVRQWKALCEELGTSDPNEVLARVQALKRQVERDDAPDEDGEGLVTVSEVEEVFQEMNEKIEKLRERNAALAEQLEADGDGLHRETEQLLETLDATTVDEAREHVQHLSRRLEALYREQEQLAQAGLSGAEEALSEIERLRSERDALRRERDEIAGTQGEGSAQDEPASSAEEASLPAEIGEILGVRTPDDARELKGLIDDMSTQLEQVRREHEKLSDAGLSVEGALTMIENMEAQLADLYHHSGRDEDAASADDDGRSGGPAALGNALRDRIESLLDVSPDAAAPLTDLVRPLVDRLEALSDEYAALAEADLSGEEAVALIESMETQLNDLYRREEERPNAADRLDAIEDVLGISTRQEAEELSELAAQMEEQLTVLYEDKKKLRELGLAGIEDAVNMIESMEAQLDDLYKDKQALRDLQLGGTDEQSTFQQLEALYAERQRLQEALGVADADDVIEMVETLTSQLDDLYTGRDATLDPEERHDAQLWSPDAPSDLPEEQPADAPQEDAGPAPESSVARSMERQLEALYREKETLLRQGFESAEEVVARLQTQRRQIGALQRENRTHERRWNRLKSTLGTEETDRVVDLVQALVSKTDASLDDMQPESGDDAPRSLPAEADLEAVPPLVDPDTLDRLDQMSIETLNALEVGAVQLRDDGTVAALNDAALRLPGLRDAEDRTELIGKNFFRDLAPSTSTNLFVGRFRAGRRRGTVDARFPYAFVGPDRAPQTFAVHLYRPRESDTTWLLYRPV